MPYEEDLGNVTLEADSSLAVYTGVPGQPGSAVPNGGKQYFAVKVTGKNQVGLATASTDTVVGILQNKPQYAGNGATVGYRGISMAVAGGTISAGAEVSANGTGRFVAVAGTGKGKKFIALEPAAIGEMFAVFIQ